jgi:translation elongation factor EF-Ts
VIEKMVEGKMAKFYEEVCLYEQPFIKDQTITISQLIATRSASWARTSASAASPASRWAT